MYVRLQYPYFKKYYKLIATDLNKQQKLDADPKTIQINFTGNYNQWQKLWEKPLFGQFCVSLPFFLLAMLRNND